MGQPYHQNGRRKDPKDNMGRALWWKKNGSQTIGDSQEGCKEPIGFKELEEEGETQRRIEGDYCGDHGTDKGHRVIGRKEDNLTNSTDYGMPHSQGLFNNPYSEPNQPNRQVYLLKF